MSDVRRTTAASGAGAAAMVGVVLGTTTAAGTALLLYTGAGFLKAAGLLVSSALMAFAAGVWASPAETARLRARWILLILALLAAALFSVRWNASETLRAMAIGGALAVLLVLALPAYTAGYLLGGLHARAAAAAHERGFSIAPAVSAGAAFGILITTTLLIQRLEPFGVYGAGALLLTLTWLFDRDRDRVAARGGEMHMTDHVTLITGVAARGQLGYTIARRFATAGAQVVITSRATALQDIAQELAQDGAVAAIRADLNEDSAVSALLDAVRTRYGRLDSLINTAGGLKHIGSIAETTPEQWRAELQRNAETTLRMCRAALPLLRAARGAIINFAAPAGERAAANLGAYSAAKAAVIALTRALALEEKAHGVRVNAIAPGLLDTAQNRTAMPELAPDAFVAREDVAAVVMFLAGREGRGVTGETVHVLGPTIS